jgi:hypothetical protein
VVVVGRGWWWWWGGGGGGVGGDGVSRSSERKECGFKKKGGVHEIS